MIELLFRIKEFIQSLDSYWIFLILFLGGMYVFWRGCAESRKNRSSIFDMFLISGVISVIVGRVVYIILEWQSFIIYIWYWLPYEKYGDQIYLFRLLPWRFLNVFDGGIVILAMFVSLILSLTFYSLVIKRWRWKHMFFPIYFASTTMLGASFIYIGIASGFNDWIYQGLVLMAILAIFFLLFKFIYKVVKDILLEKYILGYLGLAIVWVSSLYIAYLYISSDLSLIEDVFIGIFIIWSLVMGSSFISDLRKARVSITSVSTVRSVQST